MKTLSPKGIVALGSAVLGLVILTGCGSTGASSPAAQVSSPSAATATAPGGTAATGTTPAGTAATGASHGSSAPVVLDEGANHTRITVAVGATVRVELHSTYWSPVTSSDRARLAATGSPSTAAAPSCRPGSGCGTVTTAFAARTAGTVQLTASRSNCGEAKPCAPDEQNFTVDVDVTP